MSPFKDPIKAKEKNKEYCKNWYNKNKEKKIKQSSERRKKIKEEIDNYKKTLKCEICGDTRWFCLDFHHIHEKENQISFMT